MAKISDAFNYIAGNIRYKLYTSRFKRFIRSHIIEQIAYRIRVMNPECYDKGACVICGCETPALQMVHKGCDGQCYPPFTDSRTWNKRDIIRNGGKVWMWNKEKDRYLPYFETSNSYIVGSDPYRNKGY